MRKRTKVAAGLAAVVLTTSGAWSAYGASASGSSDHQGWPTSSTRPAASAVSAARQAAARSGAQVLTVVEVEDRSAEVDVGDPGFGPGDYFLFEGQLWNAARTQVIGRDSGRCMIGIRTFTCDATALIFGKGKITVSGALFNESDVRIPITGGTANFKTARGQLTIVEDQDTTVLIFQIIR